MERKEAAVKKFMKGFLSSIHKLGEVSLETYMCVQKGDGVQKL